MRDREILEFRIASIRYELERLIDGIPTLRAIPQPIQYIREDTNKLEIDMCSPVAYCETKEESLLRITKQLEEFINEAPDIHIMFNLMPFAKAVQHMTSGGIAMLDGVEYEMTKNRRIHRIHKYDIEGGTLVKGDDNYEFESKECFSRNWIIKR